MTLPNGNSYKIVYLDTNAISEFVNNTKNFAKNISEKYFTGEYCFATSVYNILELNEMDIDFKNKLKRISG